MARKVVYWCRATVFGRPCGPWRFGLRDARRDLIAQGLGSYDDHGDFYVTVPGGLQMRDEWMDFAEAEELARSVERRHAAEHRKRLAVADLNGHVRRITRSRN